MLTQANMLVVTSSGFAEQTRIFSRRSREKIGWAALLLALATSSLLAAPRAPWTSNRVIGSPNPPAPYRLERIFPSLVFTNPVDVAPLPGSARLLVLEQGGK